jgi:hypothetical protein
VIRAWDALLVRQVETAAKVLDTELVHAPDDERLLTARAEVALRAGNPMAAMMCLNRANPRSGRGQPDIEREELKTRVMAALYGDVDPNVSPPVWSWPPAPVLASFGGATASGKSPVTPPDSGPSPTGLGGLVPSAELTDAKIIADPAGQWAASAVAGTQYGKAQYSAMQATGAPNISVAGNSPDAWCPATRTGGRDWLEVTFANPVQTTEVRVRQTDAAGALVKVEAIEPNGVVHVWWEGADPYQAPAIREIAWFAVRVPKTDYAVAKVKLTLNLASGPGYKQIDAVQLVAAP